MAFFPTSMISKNSFNLAVGAQVPETYIQSKQQCGRVVRCGSHDELPPSERSVHFVFFVATSSDSMRTAAWRQTLQCSSCVYFPRLTLIGVHVAHASCTSSNLFCFYIFCFALFAFRNLGSSLLGLCVATGMAPKKPWPWTLLLFCAVGKGTQ